MITELGLRRPHSTDSPTGAEVNSVTIIFPCLNEEACVGICVREALAALACAGLQGEVLVVDNGSTDGSAAEATAAGARVIRESRAGYGNALRAGIAAARGSILVMADADWTYDLGKVDLLVKPLLAGSADLVLGSRFDSLHRESMPFLHRYVGTPILTELVKRASDGIRVTDSQSGYRAFRRDVIRGLDLRCGGMEFASEMLIKAGRAGLRVLDVPTGYRQRIGESKLNTFGDGWRHLKLISLLAPDLVMLAPSLALFAIGLVLTVLSFISPSGLEIGSVTWQPVFFSGIALLLGLQGSLVSALFVYRSSLIGNVAGRRLRFVGLRRFPRYCLLGGLVTLAAGGLVDGGLFLAWVHLLPSPPHPMALAATAQSLLLMGGSLISFGFVILWFRWDRSQTSSTTSAGKLTLN